MNILLNRLLDLKHDQNKHENIDQSIRSNIRISGTNIWILFFAILIASVGLNVNSTAVIIGAMLISPLMAPIIGIGYGAAINDYKLIQNAARSLIIFIVISLATSSLYFLLSPLSKLQPELLARTTPTLWDVLIAFFGGCAGIIAQTRRDTSTVISGAAIATALMPPLCTVGYGIATANLAFILGAFYLFTINAFFITLATLLFVKIMQFPQHKEEDSRLQRNSRFIIGICVIAMMIPSAFLAYRMVQDQRFISSANILIKELEKRPGAFLLSKEVNPKERHLTLTFGGEALPKNFKDQLEYRFKANGFARTNISIRYLGSEKIDLLSVKDAIQKDIYSDTQQQLEDRNEKIEYLNEQLAKLQATKLDSRNKEFEKLNNQIKNINDKKILYNELINEIFSQYDGIHGISIAEGVKHDKESKLTKNTLIIYLETKPRLLKKDIRRLTEWMKTKFLDLNVTIVQSSYIKSNK
jgi:uncharacterized hydrophobic protein (TIGR00271 family)